MGLVVLRIELKWMCSTNHFEISLVNQELLQIPFFITSFWKSVVMSSPIRFFIAPGCDSEKRRTDHNLPYLEVEIINERKGVDCTAGIRYRVENVEKTFHMKTGYQGREFLGWMSPISPVNLPSKARVLAGIPPFNDDLVNDLVNESIRGSISTKNATSYAFLHPPKGLAKALDWSKYGSGKLDLRGSLSAEKLASRNSMAHVFAILFGGFVYFDDEYNIIQINAISLEPGALELHLAGPYEVENLPLKELSSMRRIHGIELDTFQEGGFVAQSYIHAEETINSKPVSERNKHGTFLFLTDNNSAISYSVSTKMEIHPNCCRETVSDSYFLLHQLFADDCCILNHMHFNDFYEDNLFDLDKVQRNIKIFLLSSERRKREALKDFPFLIHQACRVGISKENVSQLLSFTDDLNSPQKNLLRGDKNGWTPLHHACRNQSEENADLIKYLVEIAPQAVLVPDNVGRCPLHIAVDSQSSEEIVRVLLDADDVKAPLIKQTKYLKQNALHIALNRGASEGVIKVLLDSDDKKLNVQMRSKVESLPLHIGLEKKAPFSVIEMLLLHHQAAIESKGESDDKIDVYQKLNGRYPLHIACWSQNTPDVVNLLLERDFKNKVITEKVDAQEWDRIQASTQQLWGFKSSRGTYESMFMPLNELTPLHVCLLGGRNTAEITRLVLRKKIFLSVSGKESGHMINCENSDGHNALHIACMRKADPDIIALLLELDHKKETLFKGDSRLNRPFHYACLYSAPIESVKLLLHAEEQSLDKSNGVPEESLSVSVMNAQEMAPIDIAVRSDSSIDIIQLLLEPKYFNVQTQDEHLLDKLGVLISSNPSLQKNLIHKMAERKNLAIIILEAMTSIFVILSFFFGVGGGAYSKYSFISLLTCASLFLIREALQLVSQGIRYLGDSFNYYNILSYSLLVVSITIMEDKKGSQNEDRYEKNEKAILLACGILLIGNGIYFLRQTFLPFARFFGGLRGIFVALIPFCIASIMVLMMFTLILLIYPEIVFRDENGLEQCSASDDNEFNALSCFVVVVEKFLLTDWESEQPYVNIIYGLILFLVLMNVVIAIVSDAWGDSADIAAQVFWRSRLKFLSELTVLKKIGISKFWTRFSRVLERIDNVKWPKIVDRISWSKTSPYNLVTKQKEYKQPHEYFRSEIAEKIEAGHSLQANMYWVRFRDGDTLQQIKHAKNGTNALMRNEFLGWLKNCVTFTCLIILGFFFGICWPKQFRIWILSPRKWENND